MSDEAPITQLLSAWSDGDRAAFGELVPLVYDELRRLANRALRRERQNHTLDPTGLVHEAYMRLSDQNRMEWQSRSQFMAVASQLMRRVLVDHARRRLAGKRDGGERLTLDEGIAASPDERLIDVLMLDQALTRLQTLDERQAKIVELRYFAGLNVEEVSEVLAISTRTVKREWAMARAWLKRELERGGEDATRKGGNKEDRP